MRRRRSVAAVSLASALMASAIGAPARGDQPVRDAATPDARIYKVERWLKGVLHHTPGDTDEAVLEISSWSTTAMAALRIDEDVLSRLMRDPRLSSFQISTDETVDCPLCNVSETPQPRKIRPPQLIRYAGPQLHRLQVLACVAAGTIAEPECVRLNARKEIDEELSRLAALASAAIRRGDANYVLRRGALLHSDAAMFSATSLQPLDSRLPAPGQPVRVHIVDGQQTDVGLGEAHWEIARLLLDAIRPGRDEMVNSWYRATAAWMQNREQYNERHLVHARVLFPRDAVLAFLSGCEHETYGGAPFQSAVRGAALPPGVRLAVGPQRAELSEAEGYFRRALTLNPGLDEGRVRRGHVLLALGRPRDAADQLRVDISSGDPLLEYFRAMFLGAAEEALGNLVAAGDSYGRAASLYPRAQSPYVALSALSTSRGDRGRAFAEMQRAFDVNGVESEHDDPWWAYHTAQARNADELLEQLWRPFREVQP
jgi:tetratricopeptide (TPR) repeat protein